MLWYHRWKQRTFLQPLGILVVLMFLIALNGVDCPLNFYGPSMFSQFGCESFSVVDLFLITYHCHQVLHVTSAACMCNTSWTAFGLRYRSTYYDGAFTFYYNSSAFVKFNQEDLEEAAVHWCNTFHGHFTWSTFTFLLGPGICRFIQPARWER